MRNISKILQRIHENIYSEERNYLCIFMGKTGSGKSLSAITFALRNDKTFNLDRIVFNEDDFMTLIKKDLPHGSFILADEIGSWLPAREYMTITNRLLSYVIQTFRYKRLGIIWTVPLNRQVDLTLRSMADATIETVKIHRKTQEVECKYKNVDVNPMTGKVYHRFPVITKKEGDPRTLTKLFISRPEQKIEQAYLKKKERHMADFYESIHAKLRMVQKKEGFKKAKPNAKCERCGHEWPYNGKLVTARCPSCTAVVNVKKKV